MTAKNSINRLMSLLDKATDLDQVAAEMMSGNPRELLSRSAAVRTFDRDLLQNVVSKVPSLVSLDDDWFAQIVRSPLVVAVSRTAGTYSLTETARTTFLNEWQKRDGLDELNRALAEYFRSQGKSIEELYHLSSYDGAGARILFERLFDQAEREFDLAKCQNLIAVLSRGQGLTAGLAESRDKRVAQLNARSLWIDDFYRTGSYLNRDDLIDDFDRLMASSDPECWVYQVHALGGTGKTMFLRWLIARHCVPAGIPCARIDFDNHRDANPSVLSQHPARLALEIASQWNRQMIGTPLDEVIQHLAGSRGETGEPMGQLGARLRLSDGMSALVILDTLEEVLIPARSALKSILEYLRQLHQNCSRVKVVLSGRYDLEQRLEPAELALLGSLLISRNILGFSPKEAREYLIRLRGMHDDDRVAACIERSNGNPLKLWLHSEIINAEPELTAENIRTDSRVDIQYLISRIVSHIGENERDPVTNDISDVNKQLRWVIRYGVVPERLTLEYLRSDMIRKRLYREITGDDASDNPEQGLSENLRAKVPFPRSDNRKTIDFDALWQKLKSYVGSVSWVRMASSPSEPEALIFSPDVLIPMRSLLLEQERQLFVEIHSEAFDYYQKRSSEAAIRGDIDRIVWLRQMVYHDFQRRGEAAGPAWRQLFDEPEIKRRADWRKDLASDVVSRQYINDDDPPRPIPRNDGTLMIAPEDLTRAYYELAWACVDLARSSTTQGTSAQHWREASDGKTRYLTAANQAHAGLSEHDSARALLLQVTIDANTKANDLEQTLSNLRQFQPSPFPDIEFEAIEEECLLLVRLGSRKSIDKLREWLNRAIEFSDEATIAKMRERLARQQFAFDLFDDTLASCNLGIDLARKLPSKEIEARLDVFARRSLLCSGRPSGVLEKRRLPGGGWATPKKQPPTWEIAVRFLQSEARLAYREPKQALQILQEARDLRQKSLRSNPSDSSLMPVDAEIFALRARIAVALRDYRLALNEFERARTEWVGQNQISNADRILAEITSVHLFQLGDLRTAEACLGTALETTDPEKSESTLRLELLRAQVFGKIDRTEQGLQIVDRLLQRIDVDAPPHFRVWTALTGICISSGVFDSRHWNVLIESLLLIQPVEARAVFLLDMEHCPKIENLPESISRQFLNSLAVPPLKESSSRDRALLHLRRLEALRIVGQPDQAAAELVTARGLLFTVDSTSFAHLELLQAEDRLGRYDSAIQQAETVLPEFALDFRQDDERTLCAIAWLDQADRCLISGSDQRVQVAIREAERRIRPESASMAGLSARLLRAKAGLANRQGDIELAARHRDQATELFTRLGIPHSTIASLLTFEVPGGQAIQLKGTANVDVIPPLFPAPVAIVTTIEREPNASDVTVTIQPPDKLPRRLKTNFQPLRDIGWITTRTLEGIVAFQSIKAFEGMWQSFKSAMTSILFDSEAVAETISKATAAEGILDLRLQSSDPTVGAIPWEFAAGWNANDMFLVQWQLLRCVYRSEIVPGVGPAPIKWLQAGLRDLVDSGLSVDGSDSPRLRQAIRAFQARAELPQTGSADSATRWALDRSLRDRQNEIKRGSVLLIGSVVSQPSYSTRSIANLSADILPHIYLINGFETIRFDVETPQLNFQPALPQAKSLCVIHISGALADDPSTGVHFILDQSSSSSFRSRSSSRQMLTLMVLDQYLKNLPETGLKPLIILDPPCPPSPFEAIRQLVLRNAFASELFHLGHAPMILGVGLSEVDRNEALTNELVDAVAAGQTVGSIVDRYHRRLLADSSKPLNDLLDSVGAALFAHDPDSRAPGSGEASPLTAFSNKSIPATRQVFALLVGIDKYPSPIPPLRGCVNDIEAFSNYLTVRVNKDSGIDLKLAILTNQDATRDAIISAFRQHLGQARQGDVVLFYFSGHGSQEQAPEEFWTIEPDHLDETLVCYDSRLSGCWDLADKEIAKLIGEVSKPNVHVAVILDCCHSGSGTREIGPVVRRAPMDNRVRPIESFIVSPSDVSARQLGSANRFGGMDGKHVLFAACRDDEEAKEYLGDGKYRGAFSFFLNDSLKSAVGVPTYRDLFARTSALVSTQIGSQSPQLEATRSEDLDSVFLDGAIQRSPVSFTVSYRDSQWMINGGAAHGLPSKVESDTVRLSIYRFDASAADLADSSNALATCQIDDVFAAQSKISIVGNAKLDATQTYKCVIVSLPTPPLFVHFDGDSTATDLVRNALDSTSDGGTRSLFARPATDVHRAEFQVIAQNGEYVITRPNEFRPLVGQVTGWDENSARIVANRLEHMARWTQTSRLSNPTSSIRPGDMAISILVDSKNLSGNEIRLEYQSKDGTEVAPSFRISLTNNSNRPLYCGLLDLTPTYKVDAGLLSAGCIQIEPGNTAWALDGKEVKATIPDALWKQGVIEYRDLLKVIVCTKEFDARLLEQPALDLPQSKAKSTRSLTRDGTLNRLLRQVRTRELSANDSSEIDDWQAFEVSFLTVRPPMTAPISGVGQSTKLIGGVSIEGHAALKAEVRLFTERLGSRDLGSIRLPSVLFDDPSTIQPLMFTASRGANPGLSVLELSGVSDSTAVTVNTPLRVKLPIGLAANEHVLPIAYDGEFFLPLGQVCNRTPQETEIAIDRLPPPLADTRSLTGAIKIFFQKVISRIIDVDFPYPLLAAVEFAENGITQSIRIKDDIRRRVEESKSVLLYIHGIIGDTKSMVPSVQLAKLTDRYDTVLTFDYENLNTTIEDNARSLKTRLAEVGLGAGHDKSLDIVAHSMGGLVSRWFIERDGGRQIVRRLVMLGTPNGGSPWPRVVDWATIAMGLALNHLTAIPWPVAAISQLAQYIDSPTVALDEMNRDSRVLKLLQASADPNLPYVMLAGNTSIIPAAKAETAEQKSSIVGRLLSRLTSPTLLHAVANPFFLGEVNDIAVAVSSMVNIPEGRKTQMNIRTVPCDHLSYFQDAESLKELNAALVG